MKNCSLRAISPFPTVFSEDLYSRRVKTRACLGKGLSYMHDSSRTLCKKMTENTVSLRGLRRLTRGDTFCKST